jgi:3-oxoacyl-[acyl-carrier-protein] synthase-1
MKDTPICITGYGMVSALGYNADIASASARAGITRSKKYELFSIVSPDDFSPDYLTVHQAPFITDGFTGIGRLARLVQVALADLVGNSGVDFLSTSKTGCFLSIPNADRQSTGLDLVYNQSARHRLEEASFGVEFDSQAQAEFIIDKAIQWNGWTFQSINTYANDTGHAGFAVALNSAVSALGSAKIDKAIVGGVDSLLDLDTLWWLRYQGRLKTPDQSNGLQPGEACAFILLERTLDALQRQASIHAYVGGIFFGEEKKPLLDGELSDGEALNEIIAKWMNASADTTGGKIWIICDQTGEPYRAMEWGSAQVKLQKAYPDFKDPVIWFPAASFGDTAAASGAVSACICCSSFVKKTASSNAALILSSSEGAHRSCFSFNCPE